MTTPARKVIANAKGPVVKKSVGSGASCKTTKSKSSSKPTTTRTRRNSTSKSAAPTADDRTPTSNSESNAASKEPATRTKRQQPKSEAAKTRSSKVMAVRSKAKALPPTVASTTPQPSIIKSVRPLPKPTLKEALKATGTDLSTLDTSKLPRPKKIHKDISKEPVDLGFTHQPTASTQFDTPGLPDDKPAIVSNPIPRTGPLEDNSIFNVKWSKYIPKEPTKKQLAAMMLANVKEVLYGGALGGGKSDWLAYEALRFCDLPGFSAIIFRKQLTDLKQPGSLIPRIAEWLAPHAQDGSCKYIGDEHAWVFKTVYPHTDIPGPDARLQFGYIGEAAVRERYQSSEYQLVAFDELGQWNEPTDYLFMRTRIRKVVCPIHKKIGELPNYVKGCRFCDTLSQIPIRQRAASNPGPPWIKHRFGIIPDPTQFRSRHEALIAISEGQKVRWVGTVPHRPFIPAYLDDNPHLDARDYKQMLAELPEDERSRLEDGNWEARVNSRFKRRWQRFYQIYPDQKLFCYSMLNREGIEVTSEAIPFSAIQKVFTTTDPAVTTKQGPVDGQLKQKNSSAVVSTFGVHNNNLLWMDCRKFRKEIPDVVETLVEVNGIWRPQYNKIECNGVGIGVAQYAELAGLPVRKNYRKNDKLENSMSAQIIMKAGRIYFPTNTDWAETVEDDVFSWTGLPSEEDDVVDTLADAANELAPGVAREISAPTVTRSIPRAVSTNTIGRPMNIPVYGLF